MSFVYAEAKSATLNSEKAAKSSYPTKNNTPKPYSSLIDRFQLLQRTVGNRAVQKLFESGFLQPKFSLSPSEDVYEQEADKISAEVVQSSESAASSQESAYRNTLQIIRHKPKLRKGSANSPFKQPGEKQDTSTLESTIEAKTKSGQALPAVLQRSFERQFGHDFSEVRIHTDAETTEMTQKLRAKAFTHSSDIFFSSGTYAPTSPQGKQLIAHELTHTIQQGASKPKPLKSYNRPVSTPSHKQSKIIQRKKETNSPEAKGESKEKVAPDTIELKRKGEIEIPATTGKWLESQDHQKGFVNARFGKLAAGQVKISKQKDTYQSDRQPLQIKEYPLFPAFAELPASPSLFVELKNSNLSGEIGLGTSRKTGSLVAALIENPAIIGLKGIDITKDISIINTIEAGELNVGLAGVPINVAGVFSGTFGLKANDEKVTEFNGSLNVNIKNIASAKMDLLRSKDGLITGNVNADVQMKKNITGNINVVWDGNAITGEGKAGYAGEKLSGELKLQVLEEEQAKQLENTKKAPAKEETKVATEKPETKTKSKKGSYVVFGEGDLRFAFNDWLSGTAHVVIDPDGFATIIGEITPQKEFELFPQKDYNKKLFKLEARAPYGIPVVGNIYVFANVGLDAFAKLGPAKFYNIAVKGTYSTDPKKCKDFTVQGSLNVSAAAGLQLRGEAGAGSQILAHDIKAGGGINATAEIQGYAEATPIIGYREKPTGKGEDKKGEFFIRGDLEIAAQPFLGLSGDVFVEVDAPWWSPCPDKKWTWPLTEKKWPIGSNFGINASMDYVFGSGQLPTMEFKQVNFSADKFLTDMYSDKGEKGTGKTEQPGKWTEKNSKEAETPVKTKGKGDTQVGKASELPPAQSKVKPGGGKKSKGEVDPNARTADGKTVKQHEEEATKRGKKTEGKLAGKGAGKEEEAKKEKDTSKHDEDLKQGLAALEAVTTHYAKDGASEEEVVTGVKSVRRKFKVFKTIDVVDGGETWDYYYVASEGKQKGPKKDKDAIKGKKPKGDEKSKELGTESGSGKEAKTLTFKTLEKGYEALARSQLADLEKRVFANEERQQGMRLPPGILQAPSLFEASHENAKVSKNPEKKATSMQILRDYKAFFRIYKSEFPDDGNLISGVNVVSEELAAKYKWPKEWVKTRLEHHHMENGYFVVAIPTAVHEPRVHQLVRHPKPGDKPEFREPPEHLDRSEVFKKTSFIVAQRTLKNGNHQIEIQDRKNHTERSFELPNKAFDSSGFSEVYTSFEKGKFDSKSIDDLLKIFKKASTKT